MTFGFVPYELSGPLWDDVVDLLDTAVRKGGNEWADVEACLNDGRAQLWVTLLDKPIAAMVTKLDGETIEIWLAGGKVLSTSVPFLETALMAAREEGATNARIVGRKGWERILKPYGWRPLGDELVKTLGEEGGIC